MKTTYLLPFLFLFLLINPPAPTSIPTQTISFNLYQLGEAAPDLTLLRNDTRVAISVTRLSPGQYYIEANRPIFGQYTGLQVSNAGQRVDMPPQRIMALGYLGPTALLLSVMDKDMQYVDVWAANLEITIYAER